MSDDAKHGSAGATKHVDGCACTRCTGFEPGNALGVRHAAYAVLALKPRAEEIAGTLRDGMGRGYEGRFEGAIAAAAMTGAQLERAMGALVEAVTAADVRRLDQDARGWMRLWLRALDVLGLTPSSAARLGLDLARTGDELARHIAERYGDGAGEGDGPAATESEAS